MSIANVEVVRSIYEAFARKDVPAILAKISDEAEIFQSSEVPWGGTYRGKAGVQAFVGKLISHVQSVVTIERTIDAGDHVVVIGRTRGTAKQSGAAFDVPVAHVWEVRDGLAVRVQYLIDNPTMLAALRATS